MQRFVFLHVRQKGINQTYSKAKDEEQGDYKATLRSLYGVLEAKFSCTALIYNCSIKLMQFDHKIWNTFEKGNISHTTNFYAFCLKQRIRHTPLTGMLAKTLYHRSFKSTFDSLIPKPPLPEVTFNKQHIPKIYYPMAGILPRTQNRRSGWREKGGRGGRTQVLYLITASFKTLASLRTIVPLLICSYMQFLPSLRHLLISKH